MKKLILILLLLPLFCSSQVLFDKPMVKCYVNEKTEQFSCFETLEGSKIYIENNFLVIDIKTSVYKYKITEKQHTENFTKLLLESGNDKYSFVYETNFKSKDQWLIMYVNDDRSERISYSNAY